METQSEIQKTNQIHFKSNEIEKSIKKDGFYKQDLITIYPLLDFDQYIPQDEYIPPEEDFVFALENKDGNIPFLGVVNINFKRFGYCLNKYINGDIYFGYYYKDIINKKGFYSYKPKIENEYKYSQYYLGSWENNLFEGFGIYLWIKEHKDIIPFSDFNNTNFNAFIGNSEKGVYKKGILLNYKDCNNYFIYYGNFSDKGKKEGNNCFYYCSNLDEICYGTYRDDIFIEGFVGKFNKDNGKMSDLIIYKNEENKNKEGIKIKIENEKNIEFIMNKFRDVISSKNYFKEIYEEFKNVLKFREEKMNNINIITNNNKYEEIIKLFEEEKIKIYKDLENNIGI